MENREVIEWLKGGVVAYEVDDKGRPNGNVTCELTQEVIDLAISALEKQEQFNAQNVNSMHRSRPNVLESLNILEQAKDDKGCVPMSLVRQAFRNILEQDRWIPVTERLPKEDGEYLVTFESGYAEDYGFDPIGIAPFEVDCEGFGIWQERFHPVSLGSLGSEWVDIPVTAWRPLPEEFEVEEES